MSTNSKKMNIWGQEGGFSKPQNIKGGNYRRMNIDPTVVGNIIRHESTTWSKSNHEVKNWCVGGESSFACRPLRFDGEVYVCPQAL